MSSLSSTGSAYWRQSKHNTRATQRSNNSYLAETSSVNDNLVVFAHCLQEVVHARTFQYVELMPGIFDFDRDDEIGVKNRLASNCQYNWAIKSMPLNAL